MNNKTIVKVSTSIIDTGTFFIIGDFANVSLIYNAIPDARQLRDLAYWELPCKTNVNVTLAFGGKSWPIPRSSFILPRDIIGEEGPASLGEDRCIGGIVHATGSRQDGSERWVIGDVFLRGVYTVFDVGKKKIGFAELNEQF